jgi:hypothetical protein
MYGRMHVRMYGCMDVGICVCIYAYMYVYIYVYKFCMNTCLSSVSNSLLYVCIIGKELCRKDLMAKNIKKKRRQLEKEGDDDDNNNNNRYDYDGDNFLMMMMMMMMMIINHFLYSQHSLL